jgi:saccharopine dehydrogenase (NADP+, L-glutamate forming)
MKNVLVLGAGLVARPLVRYLLALPGYQVIVATRTVSKAHELIGGHPNGKAVPLLVDDSESLEKLIIGCDLAVSLVPYTYHVAIAKLCLKHKKHLMTTSYISPAMKELDGQAKSAGLVFMNELGLDPGIDHMSAMKVIDTVKKDGGKITGFRSYCGGLPAPEANDNPFGYKFSWSPRGVVMAGRNEAHYLWDGVQKDIPGPELFDNHWPVEVPGGMKFEGYPNRNSLPYTEQYGVEGTKTMFRGTLRNDGWCRTWKKIADMGYLNESKIETAGLTFGKLTASLIKSAGKDVKAETAAFCKVPVTSDIISRLEWLGLFSDEPVAKGKSNAMDILCALLIDKLSYKPGEKDLIVLFHEFHAEYPGGKKQRITSTLVDSGPVGVEDGDSAMSRTVSLPAAIGTRLILEGKINAPGVHAPTSPSVYLPILAELESLGINCKEEWGAKA